MQNEFDGKQPSRFLSRILDEWFVIPGTNRKVGIDAILGIIPGIGDSISMTLGGFIVVQAALEGVSRWTLFRMMLNLIIDQFISIVPVIGDLSDIFWKANVRNIELWEKAAGQKTYKKDMLFVIFSICIVLVLISLSIFLSLKLLAFILSAIT